MIKLVIDYASLFFISVIIHEIMHIKSQGLFMSGSIYIYKWRFKCNVDDVKYHNLYLISGGLYTGILYIILSLLYVEIREILIAIGIQHIIYGIFEWKYLLVMPSRYYSIIKDCIFICGTITFAVIYLYYNL